MAMEEGGGRAAPEPAGGERREPLPRVADLDGILALRARIAAAALESRVRPEAGAVLPAAASAVVAAFLAGGHRAVEGSLERHAEGGLTIRLEGRGGTGDSPLLPTLPPHLPGGVRVVDEGAGRWRVEAPPPGGTAPRLTGAAALAEAELALLRLASPPPEAVSPTYVVPVRPVMEALRAAFAARAREAGVTLDVRTPDGDPAVRAEQDRLFGLLSDLMGNAFRFSRQGDRVTLSVTQGEREVTFTVRDTGPGIPPELLRNLLNWDWSNADGTSAPAGAGPGLTLVRRGVERMGGRLTAESRVGAGTAIHLTLAAS